MASIVRSSIVVGFFTFISRIFGYVRDMVVASYLGTSHWADIYTVAFKLPNTFRNIFGEGAFNSAFIPIYTKKLTQDKSSASNFANNAFTILVLLLILFILLIELGMDKFMFVIAPGFSKHSEKFGTAIELARITTPYLLWISIVVLISGILNSIGRFSLPAVIPAILSTSMVLALVLFEKYFPSPVHALSIGVLIAGFIQFLIMYFAARKKSVQPKLVKPKFDNDTKKMFKNMVPVIIGSSIVQINLWVGTGIASSIPGAVTVLYIAERLNQFPLSIIGIGLGTVLLPLLTKYLSSNEKEKANHVFSKSIEFGLMLSFPCSFAFFSIGDDIIKLLFERNAFTSQDTILVWEALCGLTLGLPAFILIKILTPRFYASFDTKTPVMISIVALAVNFSVSILTVESLKHIGIAFASAIAGWINVSMLLFFLARKNLYKFELSLLKKLGLIITASFVMFFSLEFLDYILAFSAISKITLVFKVLISIIFGIFIYFASLIIFGIIKSDDLRMITKSIKNG